MSERLRPDDLAFLVTESATTPMHNATLEIFEPPSGGFDYDRLVALIGDRIAFVPRYRQRLRSVPGRLANPVWVDDEDFDLTYHVRRSALPRPGSIEQLRDLTARIMSRQLDRSRPLWEMYFIEGVEDGRFAILSKSHQILVDGVATIDLGQVILDVEPEPKDSVHDDWHPSRTPAPSALVVDAVRESVRHPRQAFGVLAGNAGSVVRTAGALGGRVVDVAEALSNRHPTPESPVNAKLSQQRRFVTVKTSLDDYRAVRRFHGGTVNDVILATITGALRNWLMTRAESVHGSRTLRAMVPMGVIDSDLEPTSLGSQVAGQLLSLPIGESQPGRTPAPGVLRAQGAQGDRARGGGGPPGRRRRLRADHVPRARLAGRGAPVPAALPPGHHQRARAAVPAVRRGRADDGVLPGAAAAAGARAGDRRDVLRRRCLLRAQRRPRRAPRPRGARAVRDRGARGARRQHLAEPTARTARPQEDHQEAGEHMSTRVYVPSTLGRLRGIVTGDGIGPAPFAAHAVTPALREAYVEGGDEEWEYAASSAAAQSSLALLHEDDSPRRIVVAVDVESVPPG